MSKELRFPPGGRPERDEELAALLAPLYAAPADEAYWDGLHGRILARVGTGAAGGEWWHVLHRWSRAGAIAAAILAGLAGTVWLNHRATEARMAYEAVLAEPPVYSMELPPETGAPGAGAAGGGAADRARPRVP
jgi:hypothetical protein